LSYNEIRRSLPAGLPRHSLDGSPDLTKPLAYVELRRWAGSIACLLRITLATFKQNFFAVSYCMA
jgi:hypothetical protein